MPPESIRNSTVRSKIATAFFGLLYIAGNMSNAIYPLFVNALSHTPATASANVGQLAAAEFLAYGLVILLAGKFFPRQNLRLAVSICLGIQLLTACATSFVPAGTLIFLRLLYGAASGVLVWISYGYIAQSMRPGRLAALYTAGLMSVASVGSYLGLSIVPQLYGYASIFVFITITSVLALVLIGACPKTHPRPSGGADAGPKAGPCFSLAPLAALLSIGFFSAYTSIFWVYSDPIAQHLTGSLVKYWLTISLVSQIVGALCAAVLVERLSVVLTLTVGFCLLIAQIINMMLGVNGTMFVVWSAVYGFLGYFLIPFFVRGIASMDQRNVMITYVPAAQLLSASLGPMLVSVLVEESDLNGGLIIALAAILIAPLFFYAATLVRRNPRGWKQVGDAPA